MAPPLYRSSAIATLSESSKHELVDELGFRADRVTVVHPGIDPRFSPGGERSPEPMVVAVGRLAPVKRYDVLVRAAHHARQQVPGLRLVIVGDGYEKPRVEAVIDELDAGDWVTLRGHVTDGELVDLYRRTWIVASASAREGWGMTMTEAAACGTPAVATRIAGHADAVRDGPVRPAGRPRPRQPRRRHGPGARRRGAAGPARRGRPRRGRASSRGRTRRRSLMRVVADEVSRRRSRR